MKDAFFFDIVHPDWNYPRAFANYVTAEGHLYKVKENKEAVFSEEDYKIVFQEIASRLYAFFYLKEFCEMNKVIRSQFYVSFDAVKTCEGIWDIYRNQNKKVLDEVTVLDCDYYQEENFSRLTLWEICLGITQFVCKGTLERFSRMNSSLNEYMFDYILRDIYRKFFSLYHLEKDKKFSSLNGLIEYHFRENNRCSFSLEACEKVCPKIKDFFLAR